MPLIVCLHAHGPHAGHTQARALASQCVTAKRASCTSTVVCVHHAQVSWISKQPGIICPPGESSLGTLSYTQLYILHAANSA